FVLLATSSETPLWVQLNSELLAEEIVRTLVGSIGLVVAVPLTSALAALFVQRSDVSFLQPSSHAPHSH
ncbi:MAG: YibE/F family protein, partial [Pseudomonadales bacterium]|nr:YibE/F family protein [Pseudomonadales bacterium]